MSFITTDVKGYVKANEKELLIKTQSLGKTTGLVKFIPNVKGSMQLNLLNSAPSIQTFSCGWNAAGTSTLSKRVLTTATFKINTAFCSNDLDNTFAEWGIKKVANPDTLPFEEYFIQDIINEIQIKVDKLIWRGDLTGSTSTELDEIDGFIKILEKESSVIAAKVSGKTLLSNPLDAINAMVAKLPAELIDAQDVVIMTGNDVVMKYILAYNDADKFAGTLKVGSDVVIPNTNIKLVGTVGLSGLSKAYMGQAPNFAIGGDVENAQSKFNFWYDESNLEHRLNIVFNLGAQVYFPSQIVSYIN